MKCFIFAVTYLMHLACVAFAETSKGIEVIGAGFPRTGTSSLREALNILGYQTYHMQRVMGTPGHIEAWTAYFEGKKGLEETAKYAFEDEGYTAAVDAPACTAWEDLAHLYPEAKIILTERSSPEKWWESASETVFVQGISTRILMKTSPFWIKFGYLLENIWFKMFDTEHPRHLDASDKSKAIESYKKNSAKVRSASKDGRVLVYDVSQGWGPLCKFLGKEEPHVEFPNLNNRKDFGRTLLKQTINFFASLMIPIVVIVPAFVLIRTQVVLYPKKAP